MVYLRWTPAMETGIAVIDRDHQILVDLLNQAHACIGVAEERATLGSVINALIDYTHDHFAREEALMAAAGFADLGAHQSLHRALAAEVEVFHNRYVGGDDRISATELVAFLRSWLMTHILQEDFRYRSVVQAYLAREPGGAPSSAAAPTATTGAATGAGQDARQKRDARDTVSPAPSGQPPHPPAPPPATAGAQDGVTPPGFGQPDTRFAGLSVLVVDDNQSFLIVLRVILTSLGFQTICLEDCARQALDRLGRLSPDLILVDWRMEGLDGLAFVREVRARGLTSRIVVLSGYSEPNVATTARAAGADAFLEKPISLRDLSAAILRIMAPSD